MSLRRIQSLMRPLRLFSLLVLSSFLSIAFAGSITGVFQGAVVQLPKAKSPASSHLSPRWMYVQGKNGTIRRANIAKATFEYDDDYPQSKRHKKPEESLTNAAIVRVTAEQDSAKDGEWQATNVLIVAPPGAASKQVKPTSIVPTLARR